MTAKLQLSYLTYGKSICKVQPHPTARPLPLEFDFQNPVECARKIMAIMSNASGGHRLERCRLHYNVKHQSANLSANGAHVYYSTGEKIDLAGKSENEIRDYITDMQATSVTVELGTVQTDQYGNGWKRAKWS